MLTELMGGGGDVAVRTHDPRGKGLVKTRRSYVSPRHLVPSIPQSQGWNGLCDISRWSLRTAPFH